MKKMYLLCMALIGSSFMSVANAGQYDFDGNLNLAGSPEKVQSKVKAEFENDKALIIGPQPRYYLPVNQQISADEGTIELKIKPLDWTGQERKFQFFFTCRLKHDTIQLQRMPNGVLAFLIGNLANRQLSAITLPVNDWQKGDWHVIKASWNRDKIFLSVDGFQAIPVARKYSKLTLPEQFLLGGINYAPCGGKSAVDYLKLSNKAAF